MVQSNETEIVDRSGDTNELFGNVMFSENQSHEMSVNCDRNNLNSVMGSESNNINCTKVLKKIPQQAGIHLALISGFRSFIIFYSYNLF